MKYNKLLVNQRQDIGMLLQVKRYIEENQLIAAGDRICIGVSGGADSVCLLHILSELYENQGIELFVVHVHHGIRKEEADEDERFVRELAKKLSLPYFAFHFDVVQIAKDQGISEEEAGRKVRYESFQKICLEHQCNKMAIAHNRNDNAETVLFQLFRGTGLGGLKGIMSKREIETEEGFLIQLIRPILCLTRQEIESYLSNVHVVYRTDSSNLKNEYSRNKLRNVVIPYVEKEINSAVIDHIVNTANQLTEIEAYLKKQQELAYDKLVVRDSCGLRIHRKEFYKEDVIIQKYVVLAALDRLIPGRKDIESKHLEDILALGERQVGKEIHLPYGIRVIQEYDAIRFTNTKEYPKNSKIQGIEIVLPGKTHLHEHNLVISTKIIEYENTMVLPKNSCIKWFDYDKIVHVLMIRNRLEGDFLVINSHGGSKKLKDYFIDHKIPRDKRDHILLIADGSHIMWIMEDNRMSEKYKVSESTKTILEMNIINAEEKDHDR